MVSRGFNPIRNSIRAVCCRKLSSQPCYIVIFAVFIQLSSALATNVHTWRCTFSLSHSLSWPSGVISFLCLFELHHWLVRRFDLKFWMHLWLSWMHFVSESSKHSVIISSALSFFFFTRSLVSGEGLFCLITLSAPSVWSLNF